MTSSVRCPNCQTRTPKLPDRWLRVSVVALAWLSATAGVFIGIATGPFIIIFLPLVLWGGIVTVTAAHQFAFGDLICRSCGRVVMEDGRMAVVVPAVPEVELVPEHALAA